MNNIESQIKKCEGAHWYDFPAKARLAGLEVERLAVEAGKKIAVVALDAAEKFLEAGDKTCKEAASAAQEELRLLQISTNVILNGLQDRLKAAEDDTKKINDELQGVVDVVAKGLTKTIDLCKAALAKAQQLVTDAEKEFNGIEASLLNAGAFVEYNARVTELTVAQKACSAGLTLAKAGVTAYDKVDESLLKMWDAVLGDATKLVNITEVVISGELGKAVKGGTVFHAEVKGTFKDDFFHFSVDYDHKAVEEFFKKIFDEYVYFVIRLYFRVC